MEYIKFHYIPLYVPSYVFHSYPIIYIYTLVGGIPTPLKHMSESQLGR